MSGVLFINTPTPTPRLETVLTGGGLLGKRRKDRLSSLSRDVVLHYAKYRTRLYLGFELGVKRVNFSHKDNTYLICLVAIIDYAQYEVIESY